MCNHIVSSSAILRRLLALLATITLVVCAGVSSANTQKSNKPNFIFIFTDDQAPSTISAYGNKHIHTPNLDQLARQGMNFTNAHNMGAWDGAVCKASRAMLNSGLSVWNAHTQSTSVDKSERVSTSWAKQLEQQGYDTYFTGKWHVPMPVDEVFTYAINERPGMPNDGWDHFTQVKRFADFEQGIGPFKHYSEFMPVGYNRPLTQNDKSWLPTDRRMGGFYEGGTHWSEVLKNDALNFIDQAAKKSHTPFFMYLAFNAPHDPRQAPEEFQSIYNHEELPLPENWQANYPEAKLIGNGPSLRDAALAPFPRTPYATKVHTKEYYALISHTDAQIGIILNRAKEQGLLENTYIIFTADHGLAVGEHGLFGKQNMYEHSIKAPFIVTGPGIKANSYTDTNIYLQDIFPTTLDLAGATIPDSTYFKSLTPILSGQEYTSEYAHIYGAYRDKQRMIKKDGFKLIVYPTANKIKLFNLKEDPNEIHDLSEKLDYKSLISDLYQELRKSQSQLNDPLILPAQPVGT